MKNKRINNKNYESYIIDFLDGNLIKDLQEELNEFIEDNPEIKKEFWGTMNYNAIPSNEIKFNFKQALKQNDDNAIIAINEDNCHEFMIAYYENELNEAQKQSLFHFLAENPKLENDFSLYKHTKVHANKEILFPDKNKLKKHSLQSFINSKSSAYKIISIAATFLILFSLHLNYITPIKNKEAIQTSTISFIDKDENNPSDVKKIALGFKNSNKEMIISVDSKNKSQISEIKSESKNSTIGKLNRLDNITNFKDESFLVIDETARNYYTSLTELMVFMGDSPANINISQLGLTENHDNQAVSVQSVLSEQPILAAGNYLVNLAILGISRLEEIGSNLKESYNTLEKKLDIK